MKKTAAILTVMALAICMFSALTVPAVASELTETENKGDTSIGVTVPEKHKVTVNLGDFSIEVIEGGSSQEGEGGLEIEIDRLKPVKIKITANDGKKVTKVLIDGADVTDKYVNGVLELDPTNQDINLAVETEDVPEIEHPKEPEKNIIPWIIAGIIVLALGMGLVLFYLKKRKKS